MSGIARILLDRGGLVSGSDAKESRGVAALRARGALIRIGHDESSLDLLPGGPTAVVTTHAAIPKTNPELVEARRRGIPVILRPVVLAKLMDGYTTLMVTGTHGKTTTTSMLIVALQHSGFDPSFAVGGDLGEAGTNAHHGSGDCFVAEADESDGSLLEYTPERGGGDQHRGRPSGLLRQRRGLRRGVRRVRRAAGPRRRAGGLHRRSGRRGARRAHRRAGDTGAALRQRRCAGPGGHAAELGAAGHRRGGAHPAGRRAAPAGDANVGAGQAHGAQRARRAAGGDGGRGLRRVGARRAGRVRGRAPSLRVGRHRARGAGVRRLRPSPDRGPCHPRRGADGDRAERARPLGRGVPAALVFAHSRFRARLRAGTGLRRRGVRARRVRRAGTADGRRQRRHGGRARRQAGALRAGLLRGRRAGGRRGAARRRRRHDGRGRCHDAGSRDRDGACRRGPTASTPPRRPETGVR